MQETSANSVCERDGAGSTVRVAHHDEYDGQSSWIVTVGGSTNVVLLRRFHSLDEALGFAAEAIRRQPPR